MVFASGGEARIFNHHQAEEQKRNASAADLGRSLAHCIQPIVEA